MTLSRICVLQCTVPKRTFTVTEQQRRGISLTSSSTPQLIRRISRAVGRAAGVERFAAGKDGFSYGPRSRKDRVEQFAGDDTKRNAFTA